MYPTSGSTIRSEINSVLEEASKADDFFIGTIVMPELGVDAKSGIYPKIQKSSGELLKPGSSVRNRGSSYGTITRAFTNDTYDCIDRGLEEPVDDTDVKDLSRFFSLEMNTAKWVYRAMRLDHEVRVAGQIFNTTNFGSATNSTVAYTSANLATLDFPTDLLLAIEAVADNAEQADTVIMSPNVFNRIKLSTKLQNIVRGSRPSDSTLNITPNAVQAAFAENGIKQVLVGRARYDSAKKGQAYSAARVWSDSYIWVGRVGSGDFMEGGAGRTIVWNKEGGLFVTETYRNETIRSNMVRVRQNTTEKIIDSSCGVLINPQYS